MNTQCKLKPDHVSSTGKLPIWGPSLSLADIRGTDGRCGMCLCLKHNIDIMFYVVIHISKIRYSSILYSATMFFLHEGENGG